MPPNMKRCNDCGKLFSAAPEKTLCDTCLRNRMSRPERVREAIEKQGLESPEDIALAVGIPVDDVTTILSRLELPQKVVPREALCARCKNKECAQGSSYCSECRSALDQQFGAAARTLEQKIALAKRTQPAKAPESRMSARDALDKKRLRTTDQGQGNIRR